MSRILNNTSGKTVHGVKYAAATAKQTPKLVKHHLFQKNQQTYVKKSTT